MNPLNNLNFESRRRLPAIMAAELAECGLACLTMVARFYGRDIDLNGLRQRFSLSMSGTTLRGLMGLADLLGFRARALKVELKALKNVRTPAILHWDLDHYVVLKKVSRRGAVIHDPSLGVRAITFVEFSKHFTGVVLELSPIAGRPKISARAPMRINSLWSRATGFWGASGQVVGVSAALQITVLAAPLQIQLVVDQAVARSDLGLLNVLALGFGALVITQACLDALRSWALQVFGNLLTFQMVGNMVHHLLRLRIDFFEKRHLGDILSRLGSVTVLQEALTKGIVSSLIDGLMALVAVAVLFIYSAALGWIAVGSVVISFLITLAFFPAMRQRTEELLVASACERSYIMESVRATTTIRLMGREAERESVWSNLYANVINATVALSRYQINIGLVQSIIAGVSTTVVIFLGARAVIGAHGFSVGMLLAFMAYRQTFNDRMISFINQAFQFRLLGLHLDRLSDIVTAPTEMIDGSSSPLLDIIGSVSLRRVSFRYGPTDPWVLKDVSLEVDAGDFVAITGPSGGGKTTLLKLMLGLQTPTEGDVFLDGKLATPELWRSWREHVGVVSQDDRLLSGTLADNIAFFDPVMDMQRVTMAALKAGLHDDVVRMPMQYLTLIGDMGSSLSGGQRQRLLLARALYSSPQILFLDEGTSNLDVEAEMKVVRLLSAMSATRIVVAHRPAVLSAAARIVTVKDYGLA